MVHDKSRTAVRFYSHNFIYDGQASTADKQATRDWKANCAKNKDEKTIKFYYDSKNSIHCCNATMNWTCYYNYMTLLNQLYNNWNCYGLFDQQFKPYIYMPSFWSDSSVADELLALAASANVNLVATGGTSFMYYGKALGPAEYWIHRDDLVKVMNFVKENFIEMWGLPDVGKLSLGDINPDMVKTSQLIRVFSNLEQMIGEVPNGRK